MLSQRETGILKELIDENGYTDVLDAMAESAYEDIHRWEQRAQKRSEYEAVEAIVDDLRKTAEVLERAAARVRG